MSDVPVILLPESVRAALGEAASRDLVEVLNTMSGVSQDRVLERLDQRLAESDARLDKSLTALETRLTNSLAALEAKLDRSTAALEARLDQTAAAFEAKLDKVTAELRAEIDTKVSRAEARLIKWAFAFWASGVTALVIAILLK